MIKSAAFLVAFMLTISTVHAEDFPSWKVQVLDPNSRVIEELGPYYSLEEATAAEKRWLEGHPSTPAITRIIQGNSKKPEQRFRDAKPQNDAGMSSGSRPSAAISVPPNLNGKNATGKAGEYDVAIQFGKNTFSFTGGLSGSGTWMATGAGAIELTTPLSVFRGSVNGDTITGKWFHKDNSPMEDFTLTIEDANKRRDILDGSRWTQTNNGAGAGNTFTFSKGIMHWQHASGEGSGTDYSYRVEGNKLITRLLPIGRYSDEQTSIIEESTISGSHSMFR